MTSPSDVGIGAGIDARGRDLEPQVAARLVHEHWGGGDVADPPIDWLRCRATIAQAAVVIETNGVTL